MKEDIIVEIRKRIYEFFHPTLESIIERFAIVEIQGITQEEAEELLKILDEWKGEL
ncbi:MAG: hypothetical protein OSJ72_11635 [Lachnospiraceae bacterium]|nr:hypothetical protein [Lachnospiraceae bacterium]